LKGGGGGDFFRGGRRKRIEKRRSILWGGRRGDLLFPGGRRREQPEWCRSEGKEGKKEEENIFLSLFREEEKLITFTRGSRNAIAGRGGKRKRGGP